MKTGSNHIYNAEDIHKYLTGKLTATEMHAIEKAALNDPLLADAIDGFAVSPFFENEKSYTKLQDEFTILQKKIATAGSAKDYSAWWKFAAAAALLIGSCFTFYLITNHTDKQKGTALIQQPIVKAPEVKDTLSSSSVDQKNVAPTATDRELEKSGINLSVKSVTKNSYTNKKIISENTPLTTTLAVETVSAPPVEMKKKMSSNKISGTTFSGKITDVHNNPIPYAVLIINNQQKSTTDDKGFFNIEQVDSSIELEIISTNFYSKAITLKTGDFETIELMPSKILFKKDTAANNNGSESRVEILSKKGTAPTMGWSMYLHYLEDQLSYSTYDDGRKVTGTMIVEFKVDANFTIPNDFYFERSIDTDVNDAVMQLIQNGPQWKNENSFNSGIVKLEITF
jgi:hypothetical protein